MQSWQTWNDYGEHLVSRPRGFMASSCVVIGHCNRLTLNIHQLYTLKQVFDMTTDPVITCSCVYIWWPWRRPPPSSYRPCLTADIFHDVVGYVTIRQTKCASETFLPHGFRRGSPAPCSLTSHSSVRLCLTPIVFNIVCATEFAKFWLVHSQVLVVLALDFCM